LVCGLTSTVEEILPEITSSGKEKSFPTWYESEQVVLVGHGSMSMVIDKNGKKLQTLLWSRSGNSSPALKE
jgi:hypothetical protein